MGSRGMGVALILSQNLTTPILRYGTSSSKSRCLPTVLLLYCQCCAFVLRNYFATCAMVGQPHLFSVSVDEVAGTGWGHITYRQYAV